MTATSDQNQFRQPDTQLRQALARRFGSGRFGRPVKPEIVNRTPIRNRPKSSRIPTWKQWRRRRGKNREDLTQINADEHRYRAMNQLERLQRRRLGENIPAPLAMDIFAKA